MTSNHNVQSRDLLGKLHVHLVPAGDLHHHLDRDLEQTVSPVSKPDDDVDPLGFKPRYLFGHWLQLVVDDEGARIGHLGEDDHVVDDQDGDDEKCVRVGYVGGHLQGLRGEVADHSHLPTSNLNPEKYDLFRITTAASGEMPSLDLTGSPDVFPSKALWSVLLIEIKEILQ